MTKKKQQSTEELINELRDMPENWDGYGAKPMNVDVYSNICQHQLYYGHNKGLKNWTISLNVNGSIYLEYDDGKTSSMINLGDKTYSYYINYNGKKVKESNSSEWNMCLFNDTIVMVNNYTKYREAVSKSLDTGETIFFNIDNPTCEQVFSCKFIQDEKGRLYITNEVHYGFGLFRKPKKDIININYEKFNDKNRIDNDERTLEWLLTSNSIFFFPDKETEKLKKKIQKYQQKVGKTLSGKNPFELDLDTPVEKTFVRIYNPDGTLLIETDNDNLVTKLRCQIKEKRLSGFYLTFTDPVDKTEIKITIGTNGEFNCSAAVYYPLKLDNELSSKLLF
jgi:hypothetical protein